MANLLLAKKQCRNDLENNVFLGRAAYWVKRRLAESPLNRAVFPQFFQCFHAWGPKNTVFLRFFHHLVSQKHCISQGFSSSSLRGNHDVVLLPATVSSRNMFCCEELGRLFSIVLLRLIELWVTVAYCKQKERSER